MTHQHEEHDEKPLSEEGIQNIIEYLETVRSVVARLLSEGYTIENGEIVPPKTKGH